MKEKAATKKKVETAPSVPSRPIPSVPPRESWSHGRCRLGLFPETHTCLSTQRGSAARAGVPEAAPTGTQRQWQMPTYLPQATPGNFPQSVRGRGSEHD